MLKLTASLRSPSDPRSGPGYVPVALLKLEGKLTNWQDFWVRIFIPTYLAEVQQNFQTEGELSMKGWPSLHPVYAKWKARHFPGAKIMERSRRLRESLSPGSTSSDTVMDIGPRKLVIGTRVPYAKLHVDYRPFLVRVDVKHWAPIMRQWIRDQAKEAGLRTNG